MSRQVKHFAILIVICFTLFIPLISISAEEDFVEWLANLRAEAKGRGISEATLNAALAGLQPIPRVIELDRKQPEFTQDFRSYLNARVTERCIIKGRQLLRKHRSLLEKVMHRYGVPPRFLIAIWGLETNFGNHLGSFPVIGALATLAYDTRRSDFFRAELLDALTIVDEGHISASAMRGSWAGAMGQLQFIPSTFVSYAVDSDGDGRVNIWHNLSDVFASAANFLDRSGWQKGITWGREVQLPSDFDHKFAGLNTKKALASWQAMGVRRINGRDLPKVDINASLILPCGKAGPAFLVYNNYRVILKWNRSHFYALSVCHLADRLEGKGPLKSRCPE